EAAVDFHRMRNNLDLATQHAEGWLGESPNSIQARRALLSLISKRDGVRASLERVRGWLAERPGHDDIENLYCEWLDAASMPPWKKYVTLRRRVRRNPEDGWAWRELAFDAINRYGMRGESPRKKQKERMERFAAESERTAPEDAAMYRIRAL